MTTINYSISNGTAPVTVILEPGGTTNVHSSVPATGYFTDLENNIDYSLSFFDSSTPICSLVKRVYLGTENCINFGYLYNSLTIRGTGGQSISSSSDWEVPSDADWNTMIDYLIANGYNYDGTTSGNKIGKAVAADDAGWLYYPDVVGAVGNTDYPEYRNKARMNMLPGLYRLTNGSFYTPTPVPEAIGTIFWSSTTILSEGSYYNKYTDLGNRQVDFIVNPSSTFPRYGFSIRLVKNSTNLNHNETGQYIGNDGKKYRTICLGTQEWLADNLAETLYRDLTEIPELTDNTAWSTTNEGARCSLNNQESYVECAPAATPILPVWSDDAYLPYSNAISLTTSSSVSVGDILFLCVATTEYGDFLVSGDNWNLIHKVYNEHLLYNSWGVWYKVVTEDDLNEVTNVAFDDTAKVYISKSAYSGKTSFPFIDSVSSYSSGENATSLSPSLNNCFNNALILCFFNLFDRNLISGRSVTFSPEWSSVEGNNAGNYWYIGNREIYQTSDGASEPFSITSTTAINIQSIVVQILPNYG